MWELYSLLIKINVYVRDGVVGKEKKLLCRYPKSLMMLLFSSCLFILY